MKEITKILKYTKLQLISFLRFEAGLSAPNFGGVVPGIVGGKYNLRLQQVPEEYAEFLLFLKKLEKKSYLELGIGQGGSFFINSLFQTKNEIFHAVDNCQYLRTENNFSDQYISIINYVSELKKINYNAEIYYFNKSTDDFFKNNKNKYDIIFIDADHSYDGVKKDFENSLFFLNRNGYIIFHDIVNEGCGVKQLWESIDEKYKIKKFIKSNICGIGIYHKHAIN